MVNNTQSSKKLKVVLAGGGTGGHIYPAVAIAQLLKTDPEIEKIYYFGSPKNMELEIAQNEGLEFLPAVVSGMPRKIDLSLLKWYVELNSAVNKAIKYFIKIKPDVVLGTGGYVSAPALLAGVMLRIPIVIHDSDARPGIVSKLIAPFASAVSVSFEQAKTVLNSNKIILNGNPIRGVLGDISKQEALRELGFDQDKKTLLVVGGSQGAKKINEAMLKASKYLVEECHYQVIHQTGKKNFDEYQQLLAQEWPEYPSCSSFVVRPYFANMSIPLNAADLVVSRAGSLSISELNISGLPSILVPYPYAAQDHQRHNARAMEQAGASYYLEDSDCSSSRLIEMVERILEDEETLNAMKDANLSLAKPHATQNLIKILKSVVKKK